MKKTRIILSLVSILLTALPAFSMGKNVECYQYSMETYGTISDGFNVPFGNVIRTEKNAVNGKDRVTFFNADNAVSKYVFLGNLHMTQDGFSFSGTDTVTYNQSTVSLVNGNILTVQIDNYKIVRNASMLSTNTVAGQECRRGLYPESRL